MESTLEGESMELDSANLTDHRGGEISRALILLPGYEGQNSCLCAPGSYSSYHSSHRGNRRSLSSSLISKRQSKSIWRFHRMCSREPTRWSS